MEDSLTLKIVDIISNNQRQRNLMDKQKLGTDMTSNIKEDVDILKQYHLATYFDNESISLPKSEFKASNKPTKSISERIKGKRKS